MNYSRNYDPCPSLLNIQLSSLHRAFTHVLMSSEFSAQMKSVLSVEKEALVHDALLGAGHLTLDLGSLCSLSEPKNGALFVKRIFLKQQQEKIVYLEQSRNCDV